MLLRNARELYDQKNYSTAIDTYRLLIQQIDKNPNPKVHEETKAQSFLLIADCHIKLGDKDSAKQAFFEFFRLQPNLEEDPLLSEGISVAYGEAKAEFRLRARTDFPPVHDRSAPEAPAEGSLVALSDVDVQPAAISAVPPLYPEAARRLGVEGKVSVNVLISETGAVIGTVILKSIDGNYRIDFDRAALTAVRQWKFRPALKAGVRVKVWKPFTIVFKK